MEMSVGYEVTLSELNTQKVGEICLKKGFWGRNWVKAIAGARSTHKRQNNGYQKNSKVANTQYEIMRKCFLIITDAGLCSFTNKNR